eukprot:TRINITY_DN74_c0_g1_i1.p1 TRINITY_DN74_c0_g1~~TRINITY_DN74_c0_g1_i1.p1  ORF type:complete len:563 (+),score=116.31 TRINITY_DN74_c0_g1_i1:198-1886(+)
MKMLYVLHAIVLVLLLTPQSNAQCGSYGELDEGLYCNCYSGYSPDYTQNFQNCGLTSRTTSCLVYNIPNPLTTSGTQPPTMFNTPEISNGRLNFAFQMPVVWSDKGLKRTTVNIDFQNGDESCGYPGMMWKKTSGSSQSTCIDYYTVSIPLSVWEMCGIAKTNEDTTSTMYSPTISFTYTEANLGAPNPNQVRNVTKLFDLPFNIPKVIQSSATFTSQTPPSDASTTVHTIQSPIYDKNTGVANMIVSTITQWPWSLNANQISTSSVDVSIVQASGYQANCPNAIGSTCTQYFQFTVTPTNCVVSGTYYFTAPTLSRDSTVNIPTMQPTKSPSLEVIVNNVVVCDQSAPLDPTDSNVYTIESFRTEDFSVPENVFEFNDMIYIRITANSQASISEINLNTITVGIAGTSQGSDLLMQDGILQAPIAQDVWFILNQVTKSVVHPGTQYVLGFAFHLDPLALVNSLGTIPNTTTVPIPLDISSTFDISYYNTKRDAKTSPYPAAYAFLLSTITVDPTSYFYRPPQNTTTPPPALLIDSAGSPIAPSFLLILFVSIALLSALYIR